jgi:hypothetical protein
MTKIFAENQKVLIAIKDMIDTVATSVEHVQKQSKHISSLEHDTEKLYDGLSQVRAQSGLVAKINSQTTRLQEKLKKIEDQKLQCFMVRKTFCLRFPLPRKTALGKVLIIFLTFSKLLKYFLRHSILLQISL